MRNIVKHSVAFLGVLVSFVIIWCVLTFVLRDDTSFARLQWHDFYEQENVDILFLGASTITYGCDANYISEELGEDAFVLAEPSQTFDVTYNVMSEALNSYDLDTIYVGVSMNIASIPEAAGLYTVFDNINPSNVKFSILADLISEDNAADLLLSARRYRTNLFDLSDMVGVIGRKLDGAYYDYNELLEVHEGYEGKGYYLSTGVKSTDMMRIDYAALSVDEIDQEYWNYIIRMIRLCQKENTELVFIVPPATPSYLVAMEDNEEFMDRVQDIVTSYGASFVDFNYIRNEYWEDDDTQFWDYAHLNKKGAENFSQILVDYIQGEIGEEDFYDSLGEKYQDQAGGISGEEVLLDVPESGDITYRLLGYPGVEQYYRVYATLDDREYIISDWDDGNTFVWPSSAIGVFNIKIEVSTDNETHEIVNTYEF